MLGFTRGCGWHVTHPRISGAEGELSSVFASPPNRWQHSDTRSCQIPIANSDGGAVFETEAVQDARNRSIRPRGSERSASLTPGNEEMTYHFVGAIEAARVERNAPLRDTRILRKEICKKLARACPSSEITPCREIPRVMHALSHGRECKVQNNQSETSIPDSR